jgi:MFS family permease
VGNVYRLFSVIFSVTVFSLTYGLSSPLIALKLLGMGGGESLIGLNAAMHAIGVFIIAPFLPALFRKYSPLYLMIISMGSIALIFSLFTIVPFPFWFVLRLGLGIFSEIVMVQTETWLSNSSVEQARGKDLALYTAGMSLGFATGPLILSYTGSDGNLAFYLGALIAIFSAVFIVLSGMPKSESDKFIPEPLLKSIEMALIPIIATVLNAAVEVMGMNFLSIYAINMGWGEDDATLLISVLMFGAILLQLPVGWLSDRVNKLLLIRTLSCLAAALAFIWPYVLPFHLTTYLFLFFWGGVFVGIYTVSVTLVGKIYKGSHLAGVYSAMSVAWGIGALTGPLLGGLALEFSRDGLPWMTSFLCILFVLLSFLVPLKSHN